MIIVYCSLQVVHNIVNILSISILIFNSVVLQSIVHPCV